MSEHAVQTKDDFDEAAARGQGTYWRGKNSEMFLRRHEFTGTGEVVMEAGPASGDMAEILGVTPALEQWARSIGCTQVHVYSGRQGWERALKPMGYEVYQIVLRKIL